MRTSSLSQVERLAQWTARRALRLPRPELDRAKFGGVLLAASAAYHVEELEPLAVELLHRGQHAVLLTTRSQPKSVVGACSTDLARVYAWPRIFSILPEYEAVVVLNDWGPTAKLVAAAKARAVPTFAKVEGVQDFDDRDTGRMRRPYRSVDVVLGQGINDERALPDMEVQIVGSSRLERIWHAPPRSTWSRKPVAVINCNFTYGVLEEAQDSWVASALEACIAAGVTPLVSRHPASRYSSSGVLVDRRPMSHLLASTADVLISRFSTVPFEAMARGVPFVYYNPHEESASAFQEPDGAFEICCDPAALSGAIVRALSWRGCYREKSAHFFRRQVDIDRDWSSSARAAEVILSRI